MQRVDFAEVKRSVRFEQVLAHYGLKLSGTNGKLRGTCPLPTHTSKMSARTFAVDTERNLWACQSNSCAHERNGKKGGDLLSFVAYMEGAKGELSGSDVREAALHLADWFSIGARPSEAPKPEAKPEPMPEPKKEEPTGPNPPLAFQLKGVDPGHPYVLGRVKRETAELFGVGHFPGKGSMAGRVVMPIRNERGELVAYQGRALEGEPKYLLPPKFQKHLVLYNLDRVDGDAVVVVEGVWAVLKLHEAGIPAVALLGCAASDEQAALLSRFRLVTLLLDGDEAGKKGAELLRAKLTGFVRLVTITGQPDDLTHDELRTLLG